MTHAVASGDNLWTIASRHSASVAVILRWNAGVNPARLVGGQRIFVPGGTKMQPVVSRAAVASPAPSKPPKTTKPKPTAVRPPSTPRAATSHAWPLAIRGYISTPYSSAHPGIDIAAPLGTPVRAIGAGTVVWAGWKNNGGGKVVVIRHPNGMTTYYNHNSKVLVREGQKVARGQQIALVGATGWATGPHLDVRIEMAGRFVNPLRFF